MFVKVKDYKLNPETLPVFFSTSESAPFRKVRTPNIANLIFKDDLIFIPDSDSSIADFEHYLERILLNKPTTRENLVKMEQDVNDYFSHLYSKGVLKFKKDVPWNIDGAYEIHKDPYYEYY